jgi:hypothetical protein
LRGRQMYCTRASPRMSLMEYTHDVESIDLEAHELAAYGEIVRYSCVDLDIQNKLSCFLAMIMRPQPVSVQEFCASQVVRMWRTELRV